MSTYYTLVTDLGTQKIANAINLGTKVDISEIAIGDANGNEYSPNGNETSLVHEVWRGPVSRYTIHPSNPNWVVIESSIPANIGGFTIREVGIYDTSGALVAISNYPATYKPQASDGTTLDLIMNTIIDVQDAEVISVTIDPSVVVASRQFVEDEIAAVNGNLASKMDMDIAYTLLETKRDKSVKIEPADASADLLALITGGTVNLESIPQPQSVDKTKVINGEIVLEKTTVDVISHNINDWSIYRFNYVVGNPRTVNTYNALGVHYRHDSKYLIPVTPSSSVYITDKGNYQLAIIEYDVNMNVTHDNGYKVGEVSLLSTTRYISFVCATKDYTPVSLEVMLENIGLTAEIRLPDYSKLYKYAPTYPSKENKIELSSSQWENGSFSSSSGYDTSTTRIRYVEDKYINTKGVTKLYYKIPDGYKLFYAGLREDNTVFITSSWITGSGVLYLRDDIVKMIPIVANANDSVISVDVLDKMEMIFSESDINFKFAHDDVTDAIQKMSTIENRFKLSDTVRYIGHAGMEHYGPENTLEAYRLSQIAGMWGAECDLGITSDKKLVLMHDYTVDRTTTGTGRVDSLTLAQIQALTVDTGLRGFTNVKVPTFEQYLTQCKRLGQIPVIEVKQDGDVSGMADLVLSTLEKYNMIDDCILMSFGLSTIRYLRSKNARVKMAYLINVGTMVNNTHLTTVLGIGNCTVAAYREGFTKAIIDRFHEKGLPVAAWTVNDEAMASNLVNMGVDMIVTNGLINPNRDRTIVSTTITTTNNGNLWTNNASKLRDNATITVEDGSIIVEFTGGKKQAIANFLPTVKAFDVTARKSRKLEVLAYNDSAGRVVLNVFNNGNYVNSGSLPNAYNNIYVEVVF